MELALVLFWKILPQPEKYELLAYHKHEAQNQGWEEEKGYMEEREK